VMKAALREVKAGTSVEYNRKAVKVRIASALKALGKSGGLAAAEAAWGALVDERATAKTAAYGAKERAFLARFETPLAGLAASYPQAQTTYWLKITPPQVLDAIYAASDADLPADHLYAYAMREGSCRLRARSDRAWRRGRAHDCAARGRQHGDGDLRLQLPGYGCLFFSELKAKREPLTGYLPKGYDVSKVTKDVRVNEKGTSVDSASFPNLLTGIQALAAMLKRRRAIFRADAKAQGYAQPTTDELVYWTYVR